MEEVGAADDEPDQPSRARAGDHPREGGEAGGATGNRTRDLVGAAAAMEPAAAAATAAGKTSTAETSARRAGCGNPLNPKP